MVANTIQQTIEKGSEQTSSTVKKKKKIKDYVNLNDLFLELDLYYLIGYFSF